MSDLVVDWEAGPGGWDIGAASLGLRPVGIEQGAAECLTRAAAGHLTIRADASTWPAETLHGRLWGFIGSTPCPDFSAAGKRAGLAGETGPLVYEVMRWATLARPRWIAVENVKEVAPIFRSLRAPIAALGYSVWSGVLDVADYGVPQNRRRAFLLASLDRTVVPPTPTHSESGHGEMFGAGRLRWVTMAEALGLGLNCQPSPSLMTSHGGGLHNCLAGGSNAMAALKKRMADPGQWSGPPGLSRDIDQPARTVDSASGQWKLRHPGRTYGTTTTTTTTTTEPAPTVALGHNVAEWCWERPATCIGGTPRVAPPGYRGGKAAMERGEKERQFDRLAGAIAVELWELGVLQGFPADYPWRGNKTERARQIGNAVPPPMAAALLGQLVSP